ncbi:MAG: ATP-binding protein [Cellvibrionaceae bacterium]
MLRPLTSVFRRTPLPLSAVLVIAVLLPFLLAVGLTGWYGTHLLERHTQDRMQEDIEIIARAIRLPLSHAMERGHEGTVQRALESAFSINRVYGVYVYDEHGNTVYANGANEASMPNARAASLANRGQQQGEFGRAGRERIFSYFVPLVDAGERINGLLQVTRRGSDFDQYLASVRRQSLVVTLIAGVGLVLIVLLGHRWGIGRHLRGVESSLVLIRTGDLAHRLDHRGPRELSVLAANINQMLDALAQSRRELAEQRDRQAELTARLHQSEKLAALGQLAAGVAHELGSPLSTVDGNTQRALRQAGAPPAVTRALHAIHREAARMERIIRQLLDFSRTNPLSLRRISADYPLRSVLVGAEERYPGIAIRVDIDPPAGEVEIAADTVRLEQALGNLLHNALQAANSQILVRCDIVGDRVCYSIDDDGAGVDPAVEPHLFEPFFTTKPVGEGTGLGLAVAHAAVRDHGGAIEVQRSTLGGASFCVWLDADREDNCKRTDSV